MKKRHVGKGKTKAQLLAELQEVRAQLAEFQQIADSSARTDQETQKTLLFQKTLLECHSEASPDGILIVSEQKQWLFFNQKFLEMWQIPDEIMKSRSREKALLWAMSRFADPEKFKARLEHLYNHPNESSYDEIATKDGKYFERFSSPAVDKEGIHYGRIFYFRDVTERKQVAAEKLKLEAHLRSIQRLDTMGTLAAGVAHDFNNILTPIMASAELALSGMNESDPQWKNLETILGGARRARDLVQQILLFSRQAEQQFIAVSLREVVDEALKLLRPVIPATTEIVTELEKSCPNVMADPSQIHQVIVNLCTNAWQSMEKKSGVIKIELQEVAVDKQTASVHQNLHEGQYASLKVSDNGVGMNPATLERIFEPYFTTRAIHEGVGLGLSVVHGIVHTHKGEVLVSSKPGEGSIFQVLLPILEQQEEKPRNTPAVDNLSGRERILVVDDDEMVLDSVGRMLAAFDYRVELCASAAEAIGIFKQAPADFNLVITDLTMPNTTGLQLAQRLRKLRGDIPIVIMSGYSQSLTRAMQEEYAIIKVLAKPMQMNELLSTIRLVLDG